MKDNFFQGKVNVCRVLDSLGLWFKDASMTFKDLVDTSCDNQVRLYLFLNPQRSQDLQGLMCESAAMFF